MPTLGLWWGLNKIIHVRRLVQKSLSAVTLVRLLGPHNRLSSSKTIPGSSSILGICAQLKLLWCHPLHFCSCLTSFLLRAETSGSPLTAPSPLNPNIQTVTASYGFTSTSFWSHLPPGEPSSEWWPPLSWWHWCFNSRPSQMGWSWDHWPGVKPGGRSQISGVRQKGWGCGGEDGRGQSQAKSRWQAGTSPVVQWLRF